ncbi:retrovirus-related Pol polyprotein from transposon 297 [Trichonephila clavipes]|nr:retrovirus-related Pol polyprotein from transposon 297 [Trichonephila clavipes]
MLAQIELQTLSKEAEDLLSDKELFEAEIEGSLEFEENINEVRYKTKSKINKIHLSQPVVNSKGANESNVRTNNSAFSLNLPKLRTPNFSGNSSTYLEFINSFTNAIDANESLSNVDKFIYLKSFLSGEASKIVSGFALTENNYKSCLNLLKDKYGRQDHLISCYMNKLLEVEPVKSSFNLKGLRKLHDETASSGYVEVRNPQTAIQLLEVLAKFEERYSCKATLGSRNSNNVEGRGWNERRISNVGNNRGNWRNSEVVHRPNNGKNDYRGNYQNNRQGNQWFESRNRLQNDDRRFSDRGYQFRNRGQNDDFSRGTKETGVRVKILVEATNGTIKCFENKPGLTHVLYHEIDTEDNPPVVSREYRYDRLKQEILDYHVDKMLKEGTIIPIQSPYASPVVLCRKNNGLPPDNPEAYRFAVDYRKLNAITKYPRYPLPLIVDLIMNIPHTDIMFALDLRSGYFQMAVNPSDIVKTAFVTKNGTYAFRRMPFGLSGAAPNFQKAIDQCFSNFQYWRPLFDHNFFRAPPYTLIMY